MSPYAVIRDCLARVAWIREEDDPMLRDQALSDLEDDLAGWLVEHGELPDDPEAVVA